MKSVVLAGAVVFALLLAGFLLLARVSRGKLPETGVVEGRLRACPDSPNCVTSEDALVAPLVFEGDPGAAWARVTNAVRALGGEVRRENSLYLWATFETRWLRFVDDLELRLDPDAGVIHVRSASRVGHSDLGANRRRIEALRAEFAVTPGR